MYSIYKYTNSVNGKVYIGQTSRTLEERAQRNGRNYIESKRFYNAIKKYGWDAFIPSIIDTAETVEEANLKESHYISLYKSTDPKFGYNICSGGDCGVTSDDTKRIISEKAKERYMDKTKNPMYGRTHSEETKRIQRECKIGEKNPMYGSSWTDTQKRLCGTKGKKLNITDAQRRMASERMRELGKRQSKAILCVEDNKVFQSATIASEYYGVDVSTLCGAANGKQKTCKGKHFQYITNQ